MKRYLLLIILSVLALSSCKKQEDQYSLKDAAMGIVDNSVFTTDAGVKMTIVSAADGIDVTSKRRAFVSFTLTVRESHNYAYEITVDNLMEPAIVEPVRVENATESPQGDPAEIVQCWFGGGYLNVGVGYYVDADKTTEQSFTASYSIAENLTTLSLRRDGQGEDYFSVTQPKAVGTYVCVPLQTVWTDYFSVKDPDNAIQPEHRSMPVNLDWMWHAKDGNDLLEAVIHYNSQGTYYKAD